MKREADVKDMREELAELRAAWEKWPCCGKDKICPDCLAANELLNGTSKAP